MKKIFIIFVCCFLICACDSSMSMKDNNDIPAQEWFDTQIRHSIITDSMGHTLILHEFGSRNNVYGSYSFSIEHTPECKKCCEIYD